MSKQGMISRQLQLGAVQTADGMPIYHEVFDGNTTEAPTMLTTQCAKRCSATGTYAAW